MLINSDPYQAAINHSFLHMECPTGILCGSDTSKQILKQWQNLVQYVNMILHRVSRAINVTVAVSTLRKIFTGLKHKSFLSFMVISDVNRSFIPNKTTFTKYCLTHWISKLPRSFEIHRIRQYLVNFTGLVGIVNTTIYKTEPSLRHGNCPNF